MHSRSIYSVTSPQIPKSRLKYPSIQKGLYKIWCDALDARKQKTHLLFLNGEPDDGQGEILKGTELWSPDFMDGVDDSYRLLKMYNPNKFMATRGSNYHSDARGLTVEELILEKFRDKVVPYSPYEGQTQIKIDGYNRTYNFAWLDVNGLLLCVTHHVAGGRWFHYMTTPLAREMAALTFELDKWLPEKYRGRKFIVVRSHQHKFVQVGFSSSHGFVTPAWKLPDWFILKGGMGGAMPNLGTVEVLVESNGDFEIHPHIANARKYPKVNVVKI